MRTIRELQAAYEETRKPIKEVVTALKEHRIALDAQKKSYDSRMRLLLRVKPSSSREECVKDMKQLREKYDLHGDPTKQFQQLWDDNQQLYSDFETLVEEMWAEQKLLPPSPYVETREAAKTERELREAKWEFTDAMRVHPYHQQQVLDNSKLLQQQVRVLVQNMDDKEELLKEFTESLNEPLLQTVEIVERPKVDIEGSSDLPAEIMALIFSYVSLESALALRQVNRAWYACFKYNEHMMEEAAKHRLLGSNSVCAMVLASRLSSWTEVTDVMEDLEKGRNPVHVPKPSSLMEVVREDGTKGFTNRPSTWTQDEMDLDKDRAPEFAPCQTIVAIETKRLPADFQGLVSDDPDSLLNNTRYASEETYAMDPSRLVFKKTPAWDFAYYEFGITRLTDGSYQVTHQDWTVVLPEFMPSTMDMYGNNDTFVGLDHESHRAYVVTREFPDYRDGHGFELDYRSADRLRGTKETLLYRLDWDLDVLDTANKRMINLCTVPPPAGWRIVAQYNGAIWITMKGSRVIAPFMIDLQTEKSYYRMDLAINVVARGEDWTRWIQCNSNCGASRFLYRQKAEKADEGPVELLDLETRTVTRVQGEGHLFVGFSNGRLGAWSMSQATLEGYEMEFNRLIGDAFPEQQEEEYDVSGVGRE